MKIYIKFLPFSVFMYTIYAILCPQHFLLWIDITIFLDTKKVYIRLSLNDIWTVQF